MREQRSIIDIDHRFLLMQIYLTNWRLAIGWLLIRQTGNVTNLSPR